MTRRQQLIAGGLAAVTLILGVTLILNQKSDKKPQVLGEVITTTVPPTTVAIPGLSNSTTSTSITVTSATVASSTTLAPTTTKVTTKSALAQPTGDISLVTDNSAAVSTSSDAMTSSETFSKGEVNLVSFPIAASLGSNNVVTVDLSILNKTGKTLSVKGSVVDVTIVSNDSTTTVVPVNLGAQSTISSQERVDITVKVSLPANGTFTFTGSATGTWQ